MTMQLVPILKAPTIVLATLDIQEMEQTVLVRRQDSVKGICLASCLSQSYVTLFMSFFQTIQMKCTANRPMMST